MDVRNSEAFSDSSEDSSSMSKEINVFSPYVLAYCGYEIVGNKLVKTYYEPDPNKPLSLSHVQEKR